MLHPVVICCFLLMFGIGFAIPVGMIIFEKLREQTVAGMAGSSQLNPAMAQKRREDFAGMHCKYSLPTERSLTAGLYQEAGYVCCICPLRRSSLGKLVYFELPFCKVLDREDVGIQLIKRSQIIPLIFMILMAAALLFPSVYFFIVKHFEFIKIPRFLVE